MPSDSRSHAVRPLLPRLPSRRPPASACGRGTPTAAGDSTAAAAAGRRPGTTLLAYVTNEDSQELTVIDTRTRQRGGHHSRSAPGPRGVKVSRTARPCSWR